MRIRKKKYFQEVLDNSTQILLKEKTKFFANEIYLEIGIGRGDFIIGMAKKYPDVQFIGIELSTNVIVIALKKILNEKDLNIKIFNINANQISDYLDNKVDVIYLNFSDPWPKKKHHKKRLTSDDFLLIYQNLLKNNGKIVFKSDNEELYNYSIEQLQKFQFVIKKDDDYQLALDDVASEYETKFRSLGNKIYRIVATKEK